MSLLAALAALCGGCSVLPAPPRVVEVEVPVPELYCPEVRPPPRPRPMDVLPPPAFVVVSPGDERLEAAGAMICVSSTGYERLAGTIQEAIRYRKEAEAALDYWEKAVSERKEEE